MAKIDPVVRDRLWQMWHQGQSIAAIADAVNRKRPSVFLYLERHGGIEPLIRTRSCRHLSCEEREEISRGLEAGYSLRKIASMLGRAPSTVSREIDRNGGGQNYRAHLADSRAWKYARRPKPCKLATQPSLRQLVSEKLRLDWSPEQIALWLKDQYPENSDKHVSHETIYKTLYIQSRGALRRDLKDHLRTRRRFRQSPKKTLKGRPGPIPDPVTISERPAEVEDRAVPGHWEGDLIEGKKGTYIGTLVERKTRFVMLLKLRSKETDEVVNKLITQIQKLPRELAQSLTWDRGSELAAHKRFSVATDVKVFFCDPYSPWQRGSNENTNGLLRQYFPKGSDLSDHTQAELDLVAERLNTRPRKTLNIRTPAQALAEEINNPGVAMTS